jgi:hypothetical protein
MTNFEWETQYVAYGAFTYTDKNGNQIDFFPVHDQQRQIGTFALRNSKNEIHNGYYQIRIETGIFYLALDDEEYLFKATDIGFDLVSGKTIHYSFTKHQAIR